MVWNLIGTPNQNAIVQDALDRCDFPFQWLEPELRSEVGKTQIPVEWADLSRYGQAQAMDVPRMHDDHEDATETHDHADEHDHGDPDGLQHFHVTDPETGDKAHGIGFRSRVLGLAWYSGKVTLEVTMEQEPELAKEVFLAEGAHMVDFFYMTDEHRRLVWNAVHTDVEDLPPGISIQDGVDLGHGHGWFDVGGYYSWVGEAFMGLFIKAFSDLPVTIRFDHPATSEAARETREAFLGVETPDTPVEEPVSPPEPPAEDPVVEPEDPGLPAPPEEPLPEPEDGGEADEAPFFGLESSEVFHDSHKKVAREVVWQSAQAALDDGRRPCKVCKPTKY